MKQKPTPEEFQRICPGLESTFVNEHLSSLDEDYFQSFEGKKIAEHATLLSWISGENPWRCSIEQVDGNGIECTILAYDYPAVFSMITGLLSATGFNIVSGRIFTYARHSMQDPSSSGYSRHRWRRPPKVALPKRKIIDHFTGSLIRDISFSTWKNHFLHDLNDLFHTLGTGERESIDRARLRVNERVVQALSGQTIDAFSMLYPVVLGDFEIGTTTTRLLIEAEDTPFFLYTLSNALSLHDISIEQVRIRTRGNRVEDIIEFSDLLGNAVTDREKLNRIKISVLFTKQFTYFLSNAPDPYNAFKRFENMIQEIEKSSSQGFLDSFLKEPAILQDLARLLGASDFLWTDFLRNQYEAILPMLEQGTRETEFSHSSIDLPEILSKQFSKDGSRKEEIRILNQFKDREIYLIDLDHILLKNLDFQFLSNKLTALAETVINTAVSLSWKHLKKRFGIPVTVAGLDAKFAVMGLGKLGGAALGYASDIELLFIYSDNGETDGKERVSNSEFFERLFRESVNMIEAKREGIFHVDLRLRPFGSKGPLACSLENFIRYFGKEGSAHSYERLALIRMRSIGGDYELGRRIERIRDEIIYASQDFDVTALKELRQKQFTAKSKPGRLNAKFSPGGLVDLEYTVQILQCIHGKDHTNLRTPGIHVALEELAKAGVMSAEEAEELTDTYYFFRKLINGLRMLRGNAKDLFLPDLDSEEYQHLARRTGYTEQGNWVPPAQQLHLEFETRAATIRTFVESHIGRDSLPGPPVGNAADLVLSSAIPGELKKRILKSGGVVNTERGYTNLKALSGEGERKTLFARLAILAWDILNKTPDPDMALNNWERFIHSVNDPADHYRQLLSQPKRLEILLDIFAGSQFLADTLARNPEFLAWVTDPGHLHTVRSGSAMEEDIHTFFKEADSHEVWFDGLRKFRRRETLRIGTRDICLKKPIREIVTELSNLAKAVLRQALAK